MSSPPHRRAAPASRNRAPRGRQADPVRLAAARAYLTFLRGGPFLDTPPESIAGDADRRFYGQLLRTAVRHRRLLEAELSHLVNRPLARVDPELLALATLGLVQLRFLDRVPDHAAINETVKLAAALHRTHGRGWLNGVLRAANREGQPGLSHYSLGVRTSHPEWLVQRWIEHYGESTARDLCEVGNIHGGVTLRVNPGLTTVDGLVRRLAEEDIGATPDPLWPGALHVARTGPLLASASFADGWCYIQDVSSQLLMLWAAPLLHGRLLDIAAAPGGKLLHLLSLKGQSASSGGQSSGQLPAEGTHAALRAIAMDIDEDGLRRLRDNGQRLRMAIPPLLRGDGGALPFAGTGDAGTSDDGPGKSGEGGGGCFDGVLLDVPCSATGTIRKHPDLKWRKFADDIPRYVRKQALLMDEAARVLARDGLLVYATCSLEAEENELQVENFLQRHPGFARQPFHDLPLPDGMESGAHELLTASGDLLILPTEHRMGLFAALLRKH